MAYDAKIAGFQIGVTITATSPARAVADFAALYRFKDAPAKTVRVGKKSAPPLV